MFCAGHLGSTTFMYVSKASIKSFQQQAGNPMTVLLELSVFDYFTKVVMHALFRSTEGIPKKTASLSMTLAVPLTSQILFERLSLKYSNTAVKYET